MSGDVKDSVRVVSERVVEPRRAMTKVVLVALG